MDFIERWECSQSLTALINESVTQMETEIRKKKGYWYKTTVYACVLCGHENRYRERIYDRPKPEDPNERLIWHDDACPRHFM